MNKSTARHHRSEQYKEQEPLTLAQATSGCNASWDKFIGIRQLRGYEATEAGPKGASSAHHKGWLAAQGNSP
eukprot:5176484-Amphidinium_carterae.1